MVHGLGPCEDCNGDLAPGDPVGCPVYQPLGCVPADGRVLPHAGLDPEHLAEDTGRIPVTVGKHVDDGHAVGLAEDGASPAVLHAGFDGYLRQLQGMRGIDALFGMTGDLPDTDNHGMGHRHEAFPLSDTERLYLPRMTGSIKAATWGERDIQWPRGPLARRCSW